MILKTLYTPLDLDFRFRNSLASLIFLPLLFLAGCSTNKKAKDQQELYAIAHRKGYLPSQVVKWD